LDHFCDRWTLNVVEPARKAGSGIPELVILRSPFRFVVYPIVDYVINVSQENPARRVIAIVPELVEHRWYNYFLHSQRATLLKTLLLVKGNDRVSVLNISWYFMQRRAKVESEIYTLQKLGLGRPYALLVVRSLLPTRDCKELFRTAEPVCCCRAPEWWSHRRSQPSTGERDPTDTSSFIGYTRTQCQGVQQASKTAKEPVGIFIIVGRLDATGTGIWVGHTCRRGRDGNLWLRMTMTTDLTSDAPDGDGQH
jgi:hypothetical protein